MCGVEAMDGSKGETVLEKEKKGPKRWWLSGGIGCRRRRHDAHICLEDK